MAKQIDYARVKALTQSLIECIGDCDEGENPDLPKQEQDIDDGGQDSPLKFLPGDKGESDKDDKKKKSKDSSLALMASTLRSKFAK